MGHHAVVHRERRRRVWGERVLSTDEGEKKGGVHVVPLLHNVRMRAAAAASDVRAMKRMRRTIEDVHEKDACGKSFNDYWSEMFQFENFRSLLARGDAKRTYRLLRERPDLNLNEFRSWHGQTLMQTMQARYMLMNNMVKCLRVYLKYGADPNVKYPAMNVTPVVFTFATNMRALKYFMRHGLNPNIRDANGNTLIHATVRATGWGVWRRVRALIAHGVDVFATNYKGQTAFQKFLHDRRLTNSERMALPLCPQILERVRRRTNKERAMIEGLNRPYAASALMRLHKQTTTGFRKVPADVVRLYVWPFLR